MLSAFRLEVDGVGGVKRCAGEAKLSASGLHDQEDRCSLTLQHEVVQRQRKCKTAKATKIVVLGSWW